MPAAIIPALTGGGFLSGILGSVVSFAISSVFQSLFAPDEPEEEIVGPLLNKRSNTTSIPVIYGTRRAGGNRVFIASSGANSRFLHVILLVSEGEIEGFEKIYIDDQELRFDSGDFTSGVLTENSNHTPVGAVELNEFGEEEDTDKYSGLTRVRVHHGAANQSADSALSSDISAWTNDHRLRGRAYIYARFEYDQDTFGGIPSITADVKGKKVASIVSGVIDDNTLVYSNNPALCLRDYLTNNDYGRGLDANTIDDAKLIEAVNYCDTDITLYSSLNDQNSEVNPVSSGSRYTLDGSLDTNSTLYRNTQTILTHMRGFLVFSSGLYKLILDKAETSEVLYDEGNIIGPLSVNLGTKKNTLNRMRATFWNPNKDGDDDTIIVDAPEVRNALDNGTTLSREIRLPFCNNPHSARYITNQEIEQSRQQIHITFTTGVAGLQNDIGDIIRLQHAQMGWGYRPVTEDGELRLIKNSQITVGNLGTTSLFNIWSSSVDYSTDAIVTENGLLYKALLDPAVGVTPSGSALCSTNPSSPWCHIDAFSQIPDLGQYGLIDLDDNGINDTNVGVDGKFIFKEFRILGLSLKEEDEVEITAIEYDATIFDNLPLTLVDNTPNTSFQNPNKVGAPTNLVTTEELYVTTNSGGVKAALNMTWDSPNNPFVDSYDVSVHTPEQAYSALAIYPVGSKVTFEGNRYEALIANGPNTSVVSPVSGGSLTWSENPAIVDADFDFLTRTRSRSAIVLDAVPGIYDVRVRSVSVTGVSSPNLQVNGISVLGLIAPPSNITGFGSTPQTDLALLQWNPVNDLDVRIGGNIQVRQTPTNVLPADDTGLQQLWSSARLLTEGKSGVTTQILVPLLPGIYLIKAVDSSGIESITPAAIVNTIEPSTSFNALTRLNEATSWTGITVDHDLDNSTTGVEKFGDDLRLDTGGGSAVGDTPLVTTGTYYFNNIVDFTERKETKLGLDLEFVAFNVTALFDTLGLIDDLLLIDGETPVAEVVVEVSTTDDDPNDLATAVWTDYIQFSSGIFNFRGARFRMIITTEATTTQVQMSKAEIVVDAADIVQTGNNLSWTPADATAGFKDIPYEDSTGTATPFFNDPDLNSGVGVKSDPFLGISADGLVPGQYFEITHGDGLGGNAPDTYEGFRISFKQVGLTDISGQNVLNEPAGGDSTISATISFDYQAIGF